MNMQHDVYQNAANFIKKTNFKQKNKTIPA